MNKEGLRAIRGLKKAGGLRVRVRVVHDRCSRVLCCGLEGRFTQEEKCLACILQGIPFVFLSVVCLLLRPGVVNEGRQGLMVRPMRPRLEAACFKLRGSR